MEENVPLKFTANIEMFVVPPEEIHIFIINGSGASGKSTFSKCLDMEIMKATNNFTRCPELSWVTPAKAMAKTVGWRDQDKSEKDRKFLSDLVVALKEWKNYPLQALLEEIEIHIRGLHNLFFIVNIRQPEDISEFKLECTKRGYNVTTILVKNPNVPLITSNIGDRSVNNYQYDVELINDKSLEEWKEKARDFAKKVVEESRVPFSNKPN